MEKRKFIIPDKSAKEAYEASLTLSRIEPEVAKGLFFSFVAEKLHLLGLWLVEKTLPYVPTYSPSWESDEDEVL